MDRHLVIDHENWINRNNPNQSCEINNWLRAAASRNTKGQLNDEYANFPYMDAVGIRLHHTTQMALAVVADGIGSQQQAELASSSTVRALMNIDPVFITPDLSDIMMNQINTRTRSTNQGTTLAMAVARPSVESHGLYDLMVTNIGDSRTYVFTPQGELKFVTEDHTHAMLEYDGADNVSYQDSLEYRQHENVDVLYCTLDFVCNSGRKYDTTTIKSLPPGCIVVVCSDPVASDLSYEELSSVLISTNADPMAVIDAVRSKEFANTLKLRKDGMECEVNTSPSHDDASVATMVLGADLFKSS